MGRPAKWSGPTTAIRVPEHLAEHLLDIARQLDRPPNNVQNPSSPQMLTSESPTGTYRLFLDPPCDLSPLMEHAIGEYCDQVLAEISERDQLLLVARLVEELGERVA